MKVVRKLDDYWLNNENIWRQITKIREAGKFDTSAKDINDILKTVYEDLYTSTGPVSAENLNSFRRWRYLSWPGGRRQKSAVKVRKTGKSAEVSSWSVTGNMWTFLVQTLQRFFTSRKFQWGHDITDTQPTIPVSLINADCKTQVRRSNPAQNYSSSGIHKKQMVSQHYEKVWSGLISDPQPFVATDAQKALEGADGGGGGVLFETLKGLDESLYSDYTYGIMPQSFNITRSTRQRCTFSGLGIKLMMLQVWCFHNNRQHPLLPTPH